LLGDERGDPFPNHSTSEVNDSLRLGLLRLLGLRVLSSPSLLGPKSPKSAKSRSIAVGRLSERGEPRGEPRAVGEGGSAPNSGAMGTELVRRPTAAVDPRGEGW
jgi:hypothetical protein